MRNVSTLYLQFFSLVTLLIMHCLSGIADAAIACYQCHGSSAPVDYRPIDAAFRNPSSGGFKGNHRPHMGSAATAFSCVPCHPGSGDYTSSHRDGKIKLASNINNSPLNARYNNSTSAFSQTTSPSLSTCTNVNCHFETATPTWGGTVFNSTDSCSQCHGSTTPLSASHSTHSRYSSVTMGKFSNHAACATCHVNYASSLNFAHATSVSRRPINVTVGAYNSGSTTYLPSQIHGAYGTCTNLYCHSPGNKSTAPFTAPNQTATWGGTLGCDGCHAATPSSGSHAGHVATTYGVPVACYKCHASTVSAGMTVDATSNHVNNKVDIAFSSTTTAVLGRYSGQLTPMQKNPGSGYANCENVYCHSNGQGAGGSWPPTYKTPKWGGGNPGECGLACHDNGLHGGANITSGSHEKHISYGFINDGFFVGCTICHYGAGYAEPLCTQCHFGAPTLTTLHTNHKIEVSFVTKYGGTYNGTPEPGDGYSTCSTVYCHSNGTSVATGTVPANTSPEWGSGAMACDGCHGNPPNYASASPKANSHSIHAVHSVSDCSICHYGTTTTGTTITDNTKHVNKAYELQAKPGYTFTYVYNSSGGSCSSVSCHGDAQWGGGGAGGTACISCHGHSTGFEYEAGMFSQGKGSWRSHATHTQIDGANAKGPNIACNACHDTNNFPYFITGTDGNADGKYNLSETDVCNTCHSPGGTYDGVNNATYGAKTNWEFSIYSSGLIRAGKEKWCASCHDEVPSVISGVSAPNIVGNESGAYTYGNGWGYYKTGHGLSIASTYAASGGLTYGAGKECVSCHDFTTSHVDGKFRTYSAAANNYQAGYRLKSVGGKKPMNIPRSGQTVMVADEYKLCLSCHDANKYLAQSPSLITTSFRDDNGDAPHSGDAAPISAHNHHLDNMNPDNYDSDWDGTGDSQISCVTCHNVHGSTQLSMVNDGKLVGREPGMEIYYSKAGDTVNPPSATNRTLAESDGTVWDQASANNICGTCHGGLYIKYFRTPPATPQAPVLSWTGESGYTIDGVEPNSTQGGSYYSFRVNYTDANYQTPRSIQVWIDENDNGVYEAGEKHDMQGVDAADVNCADGKFYRKTIPVAFAGDGTLNYRFYASDGAFDATGDPTGNSTITVANNAPVLSWSGETGYEADGIAPNSGLVGSNFTFRVKYTDADNQDPTSMQTWLDMNDDGDYDDDGEHIDMTATDAGDTTYSDGKLYTATVNIPNAGDGSLKYRFYSSDGTATATGTPTTNRTVTVTASNSAPNLSWTGETNYVLDGVNPDSDTPGSNFTFRVRFTDAENTAPTTIQLWVDENDNGLYEAGEKYDMTPDDAGDSDYTDGKLFTKTLAIAAAGDGLLNYRFYASDGTLDAGGAPTADSLVTVLVNAITVSCSGGKDHTTIQAAVNAASSGDTILVSDCTYSEKVTIDGKNITIKSVNGAAATFIDGGGAGGSVVKFQNGANSTLNGFTVQNGAGGTLGGGIYVTGSSPTIISSTITSNTATQYGGGIYVAASASALTITNSTISSNTTGTLDGAGLYLGSGASAVISGSTFSSNTARNGGGITMAAGADALLSISDTNFTGNRATANHGGAIYLPGSAGTVTVTISGSTFTNNDSADNGGAISLVDSGATFTANISNSTFTGNNTTALGSALDGGALYLSAVDSVTISGSSITNSTARNGGAIYSNANLTITDSTISGNTITGNNGGGLYFTGGTVNMERTAIAGNLSAAGGGGVYATGGNLTFTNCMVTGNKTNSLEGGGFYFNGASVVANLVNCTVAGNYATTQSGAMRVVNGATAALKNCILWNNHANDGRYPDIYGTVTTSYSNIYQPGYSGSGNLSTDPLFIDPLDPESAPTTGGNYHLLMDSPVMDTGTTTGAPEDDIDGNVRPIGAGVDMGANEVVTVVNNTPVLSWTGETGFASDGVNPDIGASGDGFEFRVNYADDDNNAPSVIQVWVDLNDNGIYEAGEKYALTAVDAGDTTYTDGKLYTKSMNLSYAGDGALKYRFYAADGYARATGQPTSDKTAVVNTVPVLSWIGSGNYTSDGVHPDSGGSGGIFEFSVRYTDANNNPPTSIQVWVDRNDNDDYLDSGEKLTMTAVNPADADYTDGKDYTRTVTLTKAGDYSLKYRFYASDGIPATGEPATTDKTVTVTNNVPALTWTGEANYTTDGVDPNSALAGSSFTFRVKYTDADNEAPTVYQVWVDANNNDSYEEGEKYSMTEVDAGDTTYTDGKLYTKVLTLNTGGSIKYRFVFNDGTDAATGTPAADSTVSVSGSNTPPVLDWTGESGYTTDGVNPDSYAGGANFTFRVKYTDAENSAPTFIQVWVDKSDNSSYEEGEKYNMTAVDAGDTTYTDGKLYTATVNIPYAGDGTLNYRFYAHDGTDPATGNATADKTVTVVNPKTVCASGCGYTTIAAAITASASGDYILVSDGTYSEKINYGNKNLTIVSINGAGSTKIQGDNTNNPVVTFSSGETASAVLDGFTIDNQATASTATRGIAISASSAPTIKNCVVEGNTMSTGQNGAGIYINGGAATIQNSTVGGNAANKNSCASGCGIYATAMSGPLTISNSTISENTATSVGAGIWLVSNGAQATTITGTTFTNNTATQSGGAIYNNASILSISGSSSFTTNTAGLNQNGGAIYSTGAAASTTIDGATFTSNSSQSQGGAIYITGSTAATPLSISNSTFTSNTTTNYGGAIAMATLTNPATISSSTITGSSTTSNKGGGIYLSGAPMTLTNTNITNCTSALEGGGIYATGATSVVNITGGSINGNSATVGGGINTSATLTADGTTFSGNTATSTYGGGIYTSSTVNLTKSVVSGNRTNQRGGGLYVAGGTTTLTNCNVTGNTADGQAYSTGGGIHDQAGIVLIYNSTFAGNYATASGGGFYATSTNDVVRNSIFWGNTAGSNAQINSGWPTTTNTDIQGGCASCVDKTGNIDVNPQFINLQQAESGAPTTAGNYHLCYASGVPDAACTALSPCIDTGNTYSEVPTDDIDGNSRPTDIGGIGDGTDDYDMGADEYVP